ncbi:protein of unknown function [Candidatus Hydrogenisulfobacillus filiaventi]|uniref:Uncharacterized protein n=1 Tax=Candidatus Hydrogenisulfobacillus filiaventi TaxID=2707344 RepID=A0A6F8ZCC0_9FIRM|nr:protein of unknown function [Candidatus Hydrogenisulfobacillus filiaventi]
MPASGDHAQADGDLLYQVEDGDKQQLGQDHGVAPLHPRLGGGDHAADVGVGQHHHDPRPKGEAVAQPGPAPRPGRGCGQTAGMKPFDLFRHRGTSFDPLSMPLI